ncbi:MAG: substrate-binding domain-containing protein [Clostridiales bacterium]|nr:substrate-binding domain-containing protein [Clostridiales bacterium]
MKGYFARSLTFLMVILLTLSMAACSSPSGSTATAGQSTEATQAPESSTSEAATEATAAPTEANKDIYIAVFPKGYVGDYWQSVEAGAKAAAADLGVTITFEGPETETDLDGQIKLIENAINKGADVIAIAPLDSKGNIPIVEEVQAAGIPVITFNSTVDSDIPVTGVETDNWAAGELGGQALGDIMQGQGKYAILGAIEALQISRDRCDGAQKYIEDHYPDMEHVTTFYSDGDLNTSLAAAADIITANPDLAGIFSNNETTTIAVATVLEERGLAGKIKHVGFDATKQTEGYIKSGTTQAIVTQKPYDMGYLTVKIALAVYMKEKVDAKYDTGCALVDMSNVDSAEMQAIINPPVN